jgi:TRAP-type C4-dicarboxylate transport system permease small subunit
MRLEGTARVTAWLANVAGLSLGVMMLASVADVILRNLFNRPIFGTVEIVRITLVYVVFLGIPETFRRGSHVTVDVTDHLLGPRLLGWLGLAGEVAGLVLLCVMIWPMWSNAVDAYEFGDTTADLMIPIAVFWAPILVGTACSIAAMLLLVLRDARRLVAAEG